MQILKGEYVTIITNKHIKQFPVQFTVFANWWSSENPMFNQIALVRTKYNIFFLIEYSYYDRCDAILDQYLDHTE